MSTIERVILLNPSRKFAEDAIAELEELEVPYAVHHSYTLSLFLRPEGVSLIGDNKEIKYHSSYFFIRGRGAKERSDQYFLSILTEFFFQNSIACSSPINRYHSFSSEKLTQVVRFQAAGIPFPQTLISRKESYFSNREYILQNISFPCVFKLVGSSGRSVWKVESVEELDHMVEKTGENEEPYNVFCIQEYIPNDSDIRVLVFENKVIGCFERISQDGFLNNISRGGTGKTIEITEEEKDLAIKATKVCEVGFGGVDLVRTKSGTKVFEVNRRPAYTGKDGFSGITKLTVPREIIKILKEKYF